MDLLFTRYADPFTLMDGYIRTARLCDFLANLSIQKQEDEWWEYYLHKVWGQSYPEFRETLQMSQDLHDMSDNDIETTIQKSMNILGNFNPTKEEGEV